MNPPTNDNDKDQTSSQLKNNNDSTSLAPSTSRPLSTLEDCQREIARLSAALAQFQAGLPSGVLQPQSAIMTNSSALQVHGMVQRAESETYDLLRGVANRMGPQLTLTPHKMDKPTPFSSPLKINMLDRIPSLFQVRTISGDSGDAVLIPHLQGAAEPRYLHASREAFKFGVTEVCFVMESSGLVNEIKFSPGASSTLLNDVVGALQGPVGFDSSRTDYMFLILETMFKVYLGCQFILTSVDFKTQFDRETFSGDVISSKGMLRNQFIDQDVPLLPAAGYGHAARYLVSIFETMFTPEHHRMQIGEMSRDSVSQAKVFRRAGVITDQFMARLNELYLDYLFARSIDQTSYVQQHRVLTFPTVSIKVDKPSIFYNSLIPVWTRAECDGCLFIYALDRSRQQKFLHHLADLLSSTNLVTFATPEQIAQLPPRRGLHDPEIQQKLDLPLTSINESEMFRALALDLSSTWVDANIVIRSLSIGPLDSVFKVFTIILWLFYFPSVARDNVPKLLFELFLAMEELVPEETSAYLRQFGFSTSEGRASLIQEFPKELYLSGGLSYPLLTVKPPGRFQFYRRLHELILSFSGEVCNTADANTVNTPRMSDVRRYSQPVHSQSAVSNSLTSGESPNAFGNQLKELMMFMKKLIEEYKKRYRDYSNKTSFGF